MTAQKRGIWLLILACLFAACSEFEEEFPLEIEVPQQERDAPLFRLAAWNIRIFSDASRDDAELRHIAQTLIDYDFIAIVEVRDEAVLRRTEQLLEERRKGL